MAATEDGFGRGTAALVRPAAQRDQCRPHSVGGWQLWQPAFGSSKTAKSLTDCRRRQSRAAGLQQQPHSSMHQASSSA